MRRREFISGIAGTAVWPLGARASHLPALPRCPKKSARSGFFAGDFWVRGQMELQARITWDGNTTKVPAPACWRGRRSQLPRGGARRTARRSARCFSYAPPRPRPPAKVFPVGLTHNFMVDGPPRRDRVTMGGMCQRETFPCSLARKRSWSHHSKLSGFERGVP
jgi:hypothetical protein